MTSEAIRAVGRRAANQFLGRPGVTGVGVGAKVVAGFPTGRIAVTVFVQEKRPPDQVSADEFIPVEFEGVATDVLVLRDFQLIDEPPGSVARDPDQYVDVGRHRPIMGGLAMRSDLAGRDAGSIGCILLDQGGDPTKVYALTCHHVVARVWPDQNSNGSELYDLKVIDEPRKSVTKAGQPDLEMHSTCCPGIFGTYIDGAENPVWDGAIVQLDPGIDYRCDIRGLTVPDGGDDVAVAGTAPFPTDAELANHTYRVRKRGMATGITGGVVIAAHCDIAFSHRPEDPPGSPERLQAHDVLIVAPNPNPQVPAGEHAHYVYPGDSGSVSMDTGNRVLGLNFMRCGGGPIRPTGQNLPANTYFGVLFPIQTVLSQLQSLGHDLIIGAAAQPGQTHTVPGRPTVASRVDGETVVVAIPEPVDTPSVAIRPPAHADQFVADLRQSALGRELLAFWQEHSAELRRLVNRDRRVAAVWHRSGGSAVYQVVLRGLDTGNLRIPATVDGEPLAACVDRLHAVLRPAAGYALRPALDRLRQILPDLAGLDQPQILAALRDVPATADR